MNGWHYVQNGRGFGPVELAALQALIANGTLSPGKRWSGKSGMADIGFQLARFLNWR